MRRKNRMRGAAVTEIALLTPLIFMATLGAFEVGRGVWINHTLSHVAREAVRYAAVRSESSDDPATLSKVASRIKREAVGIDAGRLTIQTTWTPSNQPGGTVQVNLRYEFRPITPLVPIESIMLTANSQRVIAY